MTTEIITNIQYSLASILVFHGLLFLIEMIANIRKCDIDFDRHFMKFTATVLLLFTLLRIWI